ncbi:hypothetical protein LIER_25416 [Lithospermum erythrorhizon]|uniref:Uncharacterized protein n=1 Tax=Lithospermum erythrorhizon TaxID=34254 RepID=A0AAV3R5Z6_LITER
MDGIQQGMMGTIITNVIQQLRERLPQLRGEKPVEVTSIRKETCTHTAPVRGGNAGGRAAKPTRSRITRCCSPGAPPSPRDTMAALQRRWIPSRQG